MNKLIKRFDEIITRNQNKPEVLAFIGLGSMSNTKRMDAYSDIDFFIIVKDAYKDQYLKDLSWLQVEDIIWHYQETKDGLKVLYRDRIFLEFAVFTASEMKQIEYTDGIIYYQSKDIDDDTLAPRAYKHKPIDPMYELNTFLSNIYIGLLRDHRQEKSAAFLMIQVYASNHFLKLLDQHPDDPYTVERRIEQRLNLAYDKLYPGVMSNRDSARYQLNEIKKHYALNEAFVHIIEALM